MAGLDLCECGCNDEREGDSCLSIDLARSARDAQTVAVFTHLHALRISFDLAPADRLIRPCAGITAIELVRGINVDCALSTVPHETCVRNVMLHNASAKDDHASPFRPNSNSVDFADVLDDVDAKLLRGGLEGVKVEHVTETPISESRAEHRNVVLPGPVVHGSLVIDLLSKPVDNFTRRPMKWFLVLSTRLLFCEHFVQDGHHPIFEGAIIAVRDEQVADAVHTLLAERSAGSSEGSQIRWRKTLDEIFFDATRSSHDGRDVLVLNEPSQGLAKARGDQV